MTESGWTLDTLKQHIESKIASVESAARLALSAADKATAAADDVFEKRMAGQNEWRAALDDTLKSRASTQSVEGLEKRVEALEKKIEAMLNKVLGIGVVITFIVAAIAIVGGLTS